MTNQPTIKINLWGEDFYLMPELGVYSNARLAVSFTDVNGEPFGTVTVNMPHDHLNDGEVAVKDWAENEPIVAQLIEAGWLVSTGRELSSGFVFPKIMTLGGPLAKYFVEWKQVL